MFKISADLPSSPVVKVHTTNGRGATPEEIADRFMDKFMTVSDTAHPAIRDQAHAYQNHVRALVVFYMREAIKADRSTACLKLERAGRNDLADIIRKL